MELRDNDENWHWLSATTRVTVACLRSCSMEAASVLHFHPEIRPQEAS